MTAPMEFRTKAELAYEHLRDEIFTGRLRPGDRVRISHVARHLGVSDIPVRESVRMLEAEGILSSEPHKGAVVAQLGAPEIEELFAIRAELEAQAVRRAAAALTDAQFEQLAELMERMEEADRIGDGSAYGDLNREFHFAIYRAQSYQRLTSMIRDLWRSTDWCQRVFERDADSRRSSVQEHRQIYAALRRRDGDTAADVVHRQKRRSCAWLLDHIEPDDRGDRGHGPGPTTPPAHTSDPGGPP